MKRRRIAFDRFALDLDRLALIGPDGEIAVRPKSFEVLRHLLQHAGRIVAKDELLQAVWTGVTVSDESLAQCVSEIRRALGDAEQRLVKTVSRRGYMADVTVHDATLEAAATSLPTAATSGGALDETPPRPGERMTVAVLPFEARGGDPGSELEDFADGLSDDIMAGLSRIRALLVISSGTMTGYKGKEVVLPFARPGDRDHVADGLRKCGVPAR